MTTRRQPTPATTGHSSAPERPMMSFRIKDEAHEMIYRAAQDKARGRKGRHGLPFVVWSLLAKYVKGEVEP